MNQELTELKKLKQMQQECQELMIEAKKISMISDSKNRMGAFKKLCLAYGKRRDREALDKHEIWLNGYTLNDDQ